MKTPTIDRFGYFLALMAVLLLWPEQMQASESNNKNAFKSIYEKHCVVCHGEQGDGKSRAQFGMDPSPRDFTTDEAWETLSRRRMISSVTHGRLGTGMVSFSNKLSNAEMAGVIDYIRSTFMRAPAAGSGISGQRIYKDHCAVCHGDKGNSAMWTQSGLNPPPKDFTASDLYKQMPRDRMINSVTHGIPSTAMQSFEKRLSENEIEDVVDYIRLEFMFIPGLDVSGVAESDSLQSMETEKAAHTQLVAANMSEVFPGGLTGEIEKGRRFYQANCTSCHGGAGDGKGPRSYFIKPPPRDFLAAVSQKTFNRPVLFEAISKGKAGTVMPAWEKVLSNQQIADVAEYVFQTFIYPEGKKQAHKKKAD